MTDEPTLGDVLAALVDELDETETPTDREFARVGVVFATRPSDAVMELRLGDEIAEAAKRTPDTTDSPLGADWVRFAPAQWDDMAFDRLEAWFSVAWRMAAQGKR
jgi:hypothetical protein